MNHLYKVEFEAKYTGFGEWMPDEIVHVIGNGDGLKAITKASKVVMKKEFTDEDGTVHKVTSVRVIGLEQLQQIDAA